MIPTKDRIYIVIIATLIIIILFIKSCAQTCPEVEVISKIDTTWVTVEKDVPVYTPGVDRYFPVAIEIVKTDSFVEFDHLPVDTQAILADYNATRLYEDTLRDSAFAGSIVIVDSVSRNRITSRKPVYNISIPVITNTVTVTRKEEPRNEFYFGVTGVGNKQAVYTGATGLLKTKKDLMIEAGALYGSDNQLLYQGSLKILIRFRKR